eukprot:2996555-Alexandrium_andersonii.AAC.1
MVLREPREAASAGSGFLAGLDRANRERGAPPSLKERARVATHSDGLMAHKRARLRRTRAAAARVQNSQHLRHSSALPP